MARPIVGLARMDFLASVVGVPWLCLLVLAGCTEARDADTSLSPSACVGCHGDQRSPAPLDDIHQAHLAPNADFGSALCTDCHVVPTTPLDPGHLDDGPPAEVTFSGRAVGASQVPSYDAETATCSQVACHGGDLAEPSPETFVWDPEEVTLGACGTCHELPPPGEHPSLADPRTDDCTTCHGSRVAGTHADSLVQLVLPGDCTSCHGGELGPAPADPGHDSHVIGGATGAPVDCDSCHRVPGHVLATGHLDSGSPAELTFNGLAIAENASPSWDGASCSGAYCHGEAAPLWGDTSGDYLACDSCHSAPPDRAGHPISERCDACHAAVAGLELTIVDSTRHVDGTVDFAEPSCDSCHAHASSIAPPSGAHPAHISAGVGCSNCHVVPETVTESGHLDTALPAEVTFGDVALSRSAMPVFTASSGSCTDVYCHVPRVSAGGFEHEPAWYDNDSVAGECGACHDIPPPSPHPASVDCTLCHTVFPGDHVNGHIDF